MEFHQVGQLPASARVSPDMVCSEGFLSIHGPTVKWFSRCGRTVLREFSCDSPPLHAMFCSFPLGGSSFLNSVVIVVATNKLRILSSGARYDVNLNFSICNLFSSNIGLIVERARGYTGGVSAPGDELPVLYTVTHPIMRVGKLRIPSSFWTDDLFSERMEESCSSDLFRGNDSHPLVVAVDGSLIAVADDALRNMHVYQLGPSERHESMSTGHPFPVTPAGVESSTGSSAGRMDVGPEAIPLHPDLEIRGHGLAGIARSGSADGQGADSQALMATFVSSGENAATLGGSHLRYAAGSSNRRRKADRTGSSSGEKGKVDTFYNALLGIDRTWSLQQNTSVTASWLRQASAGGQQVRRSEILDAEFGDLSFNGSMATPPTHRSRDLNTTDASGLSSSYHSRGSDLFVHGAPSYASDQFMLHHVCTIPLAADVSPHVSQCSAGEGETFFDRVVVDSGDEGSNFQTSLGIRVSFPVFSAGSDCFIDILYKHTGKMCRYPLPFELLASAEADIPIFLEPVLTVDEGVTCSTSLRLPNGYAASVVFLTTGGAMITCGTEILGPVRFTSSGAIAHVRSAFPAMSSAKIDEDNFWGSAVVQEPGNDVLICDISNCGEQCTQAIYSFASHMAHLDRSLNVPWLYGASEERFALGIRDVASERLSAAILEVLPPRQCAAIANVLLIGGQWRGSLATGGCLLASPVIYALLAVFSERIRRSFTRHLETSPLQWIQRSIQYIKALGDVPADGFNSDFEGALNSLIATFSESTNNSAFPSGDKMDGAVALFDALHVIAEDLKLKGDWISVERTRHSTGAAGGSFSDFCDLTDALVFVATMGGGETSVRYLRSIAGSHGRFSAKLVENDALRRVVFVSGLTENEARASGLLHRKKFDFTMCLSSMDDRVPHCSTAWLSAELKQLNDSVENGNIALEPTPFVLPARYHWRPSHKRGTTATPKSVTPVSPIISWCPTLSLSHRLLHYWCEALNLTPTVNDNSSGEQLHAWRLTYAFMSSYAIDSSSNERQAPLSKMPRMLALLPEPLALAVQLAIIKCATLLPPDLFMNNGAKLREYHPACPQVPNALMSRIASMDTLILTDRLDIALNSLVSITLCNSNSSSSSADTAWEQAIRASSMWSWKEVCHYSKTRQQFVDPGQNTTGVVEEDTARHKGDVDGLHELLVSTYSRFPLDERVREACRIVDSKKESTLRIIRTPDMDDAAYKAKLQHRILQHIRKSVSSCVGRGMMTFSSMSALMAEPLPIPPLALAGRVPPLGTLMACESMTPDVLVWPEFHNGVAAGLRVKNAPSSGGASSSTFMQLYTDATTKKKRASEFSDVFTETSTRDAHRGAMRYWVLYNRGPTADNSHAGALLAFGLLGHLRVLTVVDICEFLTTGHMLTTIAMLIGLAASRLGSSDIFISKTICLHIPSLLPAGQGGLELDIPVLTQAAALTGIGLLHAGSGNRTMAEFLMSELIRRPVSETDTNSRETYALSAAWALGMLSIGRGGSGKKRAAGDSAPAKGLGADPDPMADLRLDIRLLRCIEGGYSSGMVFDGLADTRSRRAKIPNSYAMDLNANSSTVIEPEDSVNIAVTSFGAIIALSLMYIQSGNDTITTRLQVPSTAFALESERPDLLFVRAMATCLIQWRSIEAVCRGDSANALNWLHSQIPTVLHDFCFDSNDELSHMHKDMSTRAAALAYLSIASGYCMGLALVHAGTANAGAKHAICTFLTMLLRLRAGRLNKIQKQARLSEPTSSSNVYYSTAFMKASSDRSSKVLVDMFLSCLSLSAGLVMSGTGDVAVLRLVREARVKNEDSSFGSQMALSMTVGMLFLCGGKAAFKRDPISVGLLLMSVCPWFPAKASDNKSHLQATRHLYSLAVEWRWLRCIDVDSGSDVDVAMEVYLDDDSREPLCMSAPCLLPELSSIRRVCVSSAEFFPAELVFCSNDSTSTGTKRAVDNIRASATKRGAGQHIVLYVKRSRHQISKPALSAEIVPQYENLNLDATSAVLTHEMTDLQSRHEQLLGRMKEKLSLKQKVAQNWLNSSPFPVHSCDDNNRLYSEIRKLYIRVEEGVLAEDSRADSVKQLHSTRTMLRSMASCNHLFQQILEVSLPGKDLSVLAAVSIGSAQPSEELLCLVDGDSQPVQLREESVARHDASLAVLALGVIEQVDNN